MAEQDLKKQHMEYMAVGLLVLVALFIGISRFKKKEADDEVFSRRKFNEEWKEVEMLESKIPNDEKGVKYVISGETTPFKSPIKDKKKIELSDEGVDLPSMTLQGMVWNSTRPQVIIDNKVYDIDDVIDMSMEGDTIKVIDISNKGVYLRYKGKDFLVRPDVKLK